MCLLVLSGCRSGSDYIEPESRIIVSALGVDQYNEELLLTAEYVNINTTNNSDSYNIKIITGQGKNMFSAIGDLKNQIDGELMLSQCPAIILGTSLDSENLKDIYSFLLTEENISLGIRIVFCDFANQIITANSDNKPSGYQIMSLLRFTQNSLGFTNGDSLVKILNSPSNELYKMPFIEYENTYKVSGCYYFINGEFGKLDILESQILYLLCEDLEPCEMYLNGKEIEFKKCKITEKDFLDIKITLKNLSEKKELETEIVKMLNKFGFTKPIKLKIVGEV